MILVYKDPTGESIKSSTHQSHNSISVLKTDTLVDLEGKIASLEGKLKEKDETIEKMKLEIETTRKVREEIINYYLLLHVIPTDHKQSNWVIFLIMNED